MMSLTKGRAAIAVLFLLAFVVYANTWHNQFSGDDAAVIAHDARIRTLARVPEIFTHDYWRIPGSNLYRPLTLLTLSANYFVSGESPWSYRLVNQLLHCCNVVLLFRLLGLFPFANPALPFLAAALFAVHPAATEAVDLVVGRAELLSFLFAIAALHLYWTRAAGRWRLHLSAAMFLLALLSKETAIVLPLLVLAHSFFFEGGRFRATLRTLAGHWGALLAYLAVRYAVLGALGPAPGAQFFDGIPRTAVAFTMAKGIAYYWRIVFWPKDLEVYYDFNTISLATSFAEPAVALSALFLAGLVAGAWFLRTRNTTLAFFILWPFICLLPVTNVVIPTGVLVALRVMYLPLGGFSVVLASLLLGARSALTRIAPAVRTPLVAAASKAVFLGVLALLGILTLRRNADWLDTETLFRRELEISANDPHAMAVYAGALPPQEARPLALRVVREAPTDPFNHLLLGTIYERTGDTAAAEAEYRRALELQPLADAHAALGALFTGSDRLDEAEAELRAALALNPSLLGAYENLGTVLLAKGEREAARGMARKALEVDPRSAGAYNLLGNVYLEAADYARAADAYQRAAALMPQMYPALFNLAVALEKLDRGRAIDAWRRYIAVAEAAGVEADWVRRARERLTSLQAEGN
ncbi:MAG TPA: tetratricopeptide repeat protein [bacterium]